MNNLTKFSLTILLVVVGFFTSAQQGKKYTIENITVTGATHLSAKTIISVSGLQVGDEITIPGTELSSAVRNIWKEQIVGNVVPTSRRNPNIRWQVNEGNICGNDAPTTSQRNPNI